MANAYVKRVMIDTGSSADILYFDAFQKLGLTDKDLVTLTSTLTGFTGDFVSPLGHDSCHVRRRTKVKDSYGVVHDGKAPISVQCHHRAPDPQPAQGGRFDLSPAPEVSDPSGGRRGQERPKRIQTVLLNSNNIIN
ncbi:hypothetical protein GW17_00001037 [Ensete ventricosum]|nr:hypothetical protein GW17_00001037 [Ensete ventricosum]